MRNKISAHLVAAVVIMAVFALLVTCMYVAGRIYLPEVGLQAVSWWVCFWTLLFALVPASVVMVISKVLD